MANHVPADDASSATKAAETPHPAERRPALPAWILSLLLHLALTLVLAWTLRYAPQGAAVEPERFTGIVLARQVDRQTEYFDEQSEFEQQFETASDDVTEDAVLATSEQLPLNSIVELPESSGSGVPVGDLSDPLPDATEFTRARPPARRIGGSIQTSIFGVTGTGTKFIYVFDRSGSMSDHNGRPLRAAKAELIASLGELDEIHQFQIIFYNESPEIFRPDGQQPRLWWADDRGTALAARFVQSMSATGGTRHMEALEKAIRFGPDVIFFLTDAKEPQLTGVQLEAIRRVNNRYGASIHTIEYGNGPDPGVDNFLKRLARQNGGRHTYVNITQWGASR